MKIRQLLVTFGVLLLGAQWAYAQSSNSFWDGNWEADGTHQLVQVVGKQISRTWLPMGIKQNATNVQATPKRLTFDLGRGSIHITMDRVNDSVATFTQVTRSQTTTIPICRQQMTHCP